MTKTIRYLIAPAFISLWMPFVAIQIDNAYAKDNDQRRFYFYHGGRGSGKSMGLADWLIERSRQEKDIRILCCREIQKSIKESVYELICQRIEKHDIENEYEILKTEIKHLKTGSRFIFAGLKDQTTDSIKSFEGIKYCWVEEAHAVTQRSLKILIPTIRKEHSTFIFSYNRYMESDPIHMLFRREIKGKGKSLSYEIDKDEYKWVEYRAKDAIGIYMNYDANPWFPGVLNTEMEKEKYDDYPSYLHIWKGEPLGQKSESIISRQRADLATNRDIEAIGQEFVGVDVARFGDDSSTFFKRKGHKTTKWDIYSKLDLNTLAGHLEDFVDRNKDISIRIDDTGVGGGLTDIMRARGYNIVPINFNQKAQDEDKYDSAISEMWFHFRDIIDKTSIPDILELREDLTERRYTYDSKGRRRVEPKRDFKKRIGRSPDWGDSLLLCYYNIGDMVVVDDFGSTEESYIYQ